ncbi:MAG: NUDIX domain-containing protein [Bacteroidia bacterium]
MAAEIERFNLRVYGIVIKEDTILLADEDINGFAFTKFPGGGVELGEGLVDALKREFMEEGELNINACTHFYTTDFFQTSAFKPEEQIISVYYKVDVNIDWEEFKSDQSTPLKQHNLRLYFNKLKNLDENQLTFPIDKVVLTKLKQELILNS